MIDRYNWCIGNINNDFGKLIFVDETSIWIQPPIHHMRQQGTYPVCINLLNNTREKLNLWGGISMRGATLFKVFFF